MSRFSPLLCQFTTENVGKKKVTMFTGSARALSRLAMLPPLRRASARDERRRVKIRPSASRVEDASREGTAATAPTIHDIITHGQRLAMGGQRAGGNAPVVRRGNEGKRGVESVDG
jgi:hypothetical protein